MHAPAPNPPCCTAMHVALRHGSASPMHSPLRAPDRASGEVHGATAACAPFATRSSRLSTHRKRSQPCVRATKSVGQFSLGGLDDGLSGAALWGYSLPLVFTLPRHRSLFWALAQKNHVV